MNPEFPLLPISQIDFRTRRREKPRFVPPTPEYIQERRNQMGHVLTQVRQLSSDLQGTNDAQRRAIFYKIEHSGVITPNDLSGTSLKLIASPSSTTSLVIPKDENLQRLEDRLTNFTAQATPGEQQPRPGTFERNVEHVVRGAPTDRLAPELRSSYAKDKKRKCFVYEIEIISLTNGSTNRRKDLDQIVDRIGTVLGRGINGAIYETEYAGATARSVIWSTGETYQRLVEDDEWQQVIVRFEPRPKFAPFVATYTDFDIGKLGPITAPPQDAPTICVIDSGVVPGNPFLEPVVREDLLKSYVPRALDDPYDGNGHGSGVASLASYYALALGDGAPNTAKLWIASARIMDADGQLDPHDTDDPDEYRRRDARLLSSMLKQIIAEFRPKGVRIFVMAYNIVNRTWNEDGKALVPRTSWVARTIDELSNEHDVVFILITGNLTPDVIAAKHTAREYPLYLLEADCRLLDPGQAVSAITVGSVAHAATATNTTAIPLADIGELSPFTRGGPGMSNAIKPEFVERGGNTVFAGGAASANLGTNVVMASNAITPPIQHDSGTSFAAPRVAHHAGLILGDLEASGISPSSCLLKCFLAQSAYLSGELKALGEQFEARHFRNLCGYGLPDAQRATDCDGSSAVLYYDGAIEPDQVALLQVPIPEELRDNHNGEKQLTVSLCYVPRVQRWGLEEYTCVRLKFRLFKGSVPVTEVENALTREEDEENVVVGKPDNEFRGEIGISARSRGTLQHDRFVWTREADDATHDFTLAVIASRASWGGGEPIRFAVVLRLEDVSKAVTTVHSTVRARVAARARA